ncbi:MAG: hypothetical protein IKF80_00040 [Erysipelotrichaceae bacterium]|nr:hypothetical protein [Erysipelotrichaceae bacterium]
MKNRFQSVEIGLLYFYIHFVTETICFYLLNSFFKAPISSWILAYTYDMLAFVPQSVIGYYRDRHPQINLSIIGSVLLVVSVLSYKFFNQGIILSLMTVSLGNALIHVEGAEVTIRSSKGKMTPSSIFVGGGSFGVIIGKLCSSYGVPYQLMIILIISMIPFVMLSNEIKDEDRNCRDFQYANSNIDKALIIIYSALIVIIRGYMGYGIPTSWRKSTLQNIVFYFSMGLGKCMGGFFIDKVGIRKTSYISILGSIPFLLFGDKIMFLSIIGVAFFSMTMAVTLAVLVSVLPENVGLAFGVTTIGLFLGSVPVFFFKINIFFYSAVTIVLLSLLCIYMASRIVNDDNSN